MDVQGIFVFAILGGVLLLLIVVVLLCCSPRFLRKTSARRRNVRIRRSCRVARRRQRRENSLSSVYVIHLTNDCEIAANHLCGEQVLSQYQLEMTTADGPPIYDQPPTYEQACQN